MSPETIQSVKDLSLDICIRYNVAPKDIITTHKRIVGWKNCPKYWTDYPDQMQKEVDEIQARWEAARAGAPRPSLSIRPPRRPAAPTDTARGPTDDAARGPRPAHNTNSAENGAKE